GGARVRIRFGESYGEANAEPGEKGAGNDHSPRDFYAELANFSDLTFGQTGFRFVRFDFPDGVKIELKSVLAAFTHNDAKPTGEFECSDPLVNEIYRTAAYTAHLCVQNGMIWDGIKRDRLVWIGDIYPEMKTLLYTYGGMNEIKNSLRFAMQTNPMPGWIQRMPSYTIWFVAALYEYVFYTADFAFLRECGEYLLALGALFDDCVAQNGALLFNDARKAGEHVFLDWQTADLPVTEHGVSALLKTAANYGIYLCEKLGFPCDSFVRVTEKLGRRKIVKTGYKQITAMQSLSGERNAASCAKELVCGGGKDVCAFMSGFILSATAKGGETAAALAMCKEYYGGMLARGATSFWEDFDTAWLKGSGRIDEPTPEGLKDLHGDFGAHCYKGYRHSLCHGWACGPVNFLTECVLGICIEEYGCGKIRVRPDLGDLQYARGSIATPYGKLTVHAEKDGSGKTITHVDAPAGIETIVPKSAQ
ncbi:MAG: alpha-L-rhamnosidase, partial [Clostridiales bacterium]|nr:alpha-L-rhamnosidase [Clostridiales bacterium]